MVTMVQPEQLILQFCISMTSQVELIRSSIIEENNQLYFVAVEELLLVAVVE